MKNINRIKSGNNGFSLVELIVVVLIMAILSVSLAPQVFKWVNNAKKSRDLDYMHTLVTAVQEALMDALISSEVADAVDDLEGDLILEVTESETKDPNGTVSNPSELYKKTAAALGYGLADIAEFRKLRVYADGAKIQIYINNGRAVGKYTINGSSTDIMD